MFSFTVTSGNITLVISRDSENRIKRALSQWKHLYPNAVFSDIK